MESEECEEIIIKIMYLEDDNAINIIIRYITEEIGNRKETDCNLN